MQNFHRKIKDSVKHGWFWALDYRYVAYWQLRGLTDKADAASYRRTAADSKGTILLIPGIYEKWQFMKPIAALLYNEGYDVHVVEKLGYNVGSIEAMAHIVNDYITANKILSCTIIAHSKGGLVGKYVLMNLNDREIVKGMIALNTPFSGSSYANFALNKSVRIFRPKSSILSALSANREVNKRIVSIYNQFDPHIPTGSYLENAHNVQVDTMGHFRIVASKVVHKALLEALVFIPRLKIVKK